MRKVVFFIAALLLFMNLSAKKADEPVTFRVAVNPDQKDLLVDELVNSADAIKKVCSLTMLYENEVTGKYGDIDLKGILLANAISRKTDAGSLKVILDEMLSKGAYKKQLDNPTIIAVEKKFYEDCERCFKVKTYTYDYGRADKTGLGASIAADIMTGYRLNIVNQPVSLTAKEIKYQCFDRKMSLPDSVLASITAHKTGENLKKICDKRAAGVDWETVLGAIIPDHLIYIKDEGRYYNATDFKTSRPFYCPNKGRYGSFLQNFDVLDLFAEAKRVSGNAAAFLEGKPVAFKAGSIPDLLVKNYKMKDKDICRFLEIAGDPDLVLHCAIVNKKTGRSIEYLIKDSKRFASFDEFYHSYLMLDQKTINIIEREFNDILYPVKDDASPAADE